MNWWSVRVCDCGEEVHQYEPGDPWVDRRGDKHASGEAGHHARPIGAPAPEEKP